MGGKGRVGEGMRGEGEVASCAPLLSKIPGSAPEF